MEFYLAPYITEYNAFNNKKPHFGALKYNDSPPIHFSPVVARRSYQVYEPALSMKKDE